MHVYLTSLGCRLNEAEVASWRRHFASVGYRVVPNPEQADLLVLNTCAVTVTAARKSRKLAARLHRSNPSAPLILSGCFSELEPHLAKEMSGVDLVVGNRDKDGLVNHISDRYPAKINPALSGAIDAGPWPVGNRTRAFIKVQDGCRNRCTFCIVTVARGTERSRPIQEVIDEIQSLHAAGHQEIVLTGVHLGGYGHDLGENLFTLVGEVLSRTSVPRVRLSSLEPWDIPDHFWQLWQDERLCPHLHLPLQSGSDRVLKRMARKSTVASFRSIVDAARTSVSGINITTDLIIGFPGETDADFERTRRVIREVGFGHVHAFAYSPRAGTAAARMPNQIGDQAKRARSRALHTAARSERTQRMNLLLGQKRPVLWEENVSEENGICHWSGLTDNYFRCITQTAAGIDLRNQITPFPLDAHDSDHFSTQSPTF